MSSSSTSIVPVLEVVKPKGRWDPRRSIFQLCLVGILAFCCPGLFNSLNGLGGVGQADQTTSSVTNGCLYLVFAVVGYFSSVPFKLFGPKPLFFVGGLSYAIYALCVYYTTPDRLWVAAIGGVVLGFGAGLFWTAQGALMMCYSTPAEKGRYITIFWAIFNLGGVFGGLLQFGLNFNAGVSQASDVSYFTFVAIMTGGAFLSLFLVAPKNVIKSDGTHPQFEEGGHWGEEIKAALLGITDKFVLKLLVFFFFSNWFYTYEFGFLNGYIFNIRTRGLNSALYWCAQMIGAVIVGFIGDLKGVATNKRGLYLFCLNVGFLILSWSLSLGVQFSIIMGDVDKYLHKDLYAPVHLVDNQPFWANICLSGNIDYDTGLELGEEDCWFIYFKHQVAPLEINGNKEVYQVSNIRVIDNLNPHTKDKYWQVLMDRYGKDEVETWFGPLKAESTFKYARANLDIVEEQAEYLALPMLTYIVVGMSDAIYQSFVYWLMSSVAGGNVAKNIQYAACYKGIQSLGAGISWATDNGNWFLYRQQCITNVVLAITAVIGSYFALAHLDTEVIDATGRMSNVGTAFQQSKSLTATQSRILSDAESSDVTDESDTTEGVKQVELVV